MGDHEIHTRRMSRNVGTAIALVVFVALLAGLTIVKLNGLGDSAMPEVSGQ
jgi:hypothetical protein